MDVIKDIPWGVIILVALACVGNIETFKGFFKVKPSAQITSVIAIVWCLGLFALSEYVFKWILYAFVAASFLQLGYQVILQDIPLIIKKLLGVEKE